MEKCICIHGHFYQPPRENAWLEDIEVQDSAFPYHDWNERIASECYGPNSSARILDQEGFVTHLMNNFSKISFNIGPTLMSWMEIYEPRIYEAILQADREGNMRTGGHGPAMAQGYNHLIFPLADHEDKKTQVIWGIEDFKHRFGRMPEGMWAPETAIDRETLEVMAEQGLKFTILAPHQAKRIRLLKSKDRWHNMEGGKIDTTRAYQVQLSSGHSMAVFFYDGGMAHNVAFGNLLENGETLAHRLLSSFKDGRQWNQLVHLATDGETFGHHHRHGEMCLAYALHYIEKNNLARIVTYGEFLAQNPPTHEVEIVDFSSWSCVHGVERWRNDCGCSSGMHGNWHQKWRAPLREAFDFLAVESRKLFEEEGKKYFLDPKQARNQYIHVILNRTEEARSSFFQRTMNPDLNLEHKGSEGPIIKALKLLEMQRHSLLMYTSCAWFFDEISGIETTQCLQYACRVLQLINDLFQQDLSPSFLDILEKAPSNIPELENGRNVFDRFVRPATVDFLKVGAHVAITSLFERHPPHFSLSSFEVLIEDEQLTEFGKVILSLGKIILVSKITLEKADLSFGAIHLGDQNMNAGVRHFRGEESYVTLKEDILRTFRQADLPSILRTMDTHFEGVTYSLRTIFKDAQRKILKMVLGSTLKEVELSLSKLYDDYFHLMNFLSELSYPLPEVFESMAHFVKNSDLRKILQKEELDLEAIQGTLKQMKFWGVSIDKQMVASKIQKSLVRLMNQLDLNPGDDSLCEQINALIHITRTLPLPIDLGPIQIVFYKIAHSPEPREWSESFGSLAHNLKVRI